MAADSETAGTVDSGKVTVEVVSVETAVARVISSYIEYKYCRSEHTKQTSYVRITGMET